jgi:excisionase family DNA binding protein
VSPMPQTPVTPVTIDDLLTDPSRSVGLTRGAIQQLYIQLASRIGTLKALESVLLSMLLRQPTDSDPAASQPSGELLTAPEAAKILNVPESWVREQARLGELPSVRLGHYVRFRSDELRAFLARGQSGRLAR